MKAIKVIAYVLLISVLPFCLGLANKESHRQAQTVTPISSPAIFDQQTYDFTDIPAPLPEPTPVAEVIKEVEIAISEAEQAIAYAYQPQGVTQFTGMSQEDILAWIRQKESTNNYSAVTVTADDTYLGAYQFSAKYMAERYDRYGLTIQYGEYSQESFVANPAAQDAAAIAYGEEQHGGLENVQYYNGW